MQYRVTPKKLILDLFRVAPEASPAPIAAIVDLGRTFGFAASTMRATVSRLTTAGLLESDARGWYRPAPTTDPFRAAIESWRRGEARVRSWAGDWLVAAAGPWARRADRRRAERAIGYVGFRSGLERLWLRPDNLAATRDEIATELAVFGATRVHDLFTARDFSPARVGRWCRELWDVPGREAAYRASLRAVERCLERLHDLPLERALVETFVYGGEAIRLLALDPLLPAELIDTGMRRALFERMTEYDRAGRARWHERFGIGRFAEARQ